MLISQAFGLLSVGALGIDPESRSAPLMTMFCGVMPAKHAAAAVCSGRGRRSHWLSLIRPQRVASSATNATSAFAQDVDFSRCKADGPPRSGASRISSMPLRQPA